MNDSPDALPTAHDGLPWPTQEQFRADMAEAEAEEDAGNTEDVDIVAELRNVAAELRAEIARRSA